MKTYHKKYYWIMGGIIALVFIIHIVSSCIRIPHNVRKEESHLPRNNVQKEKDSKMIRVLIKTNGYAQTTHNKVELKAKNGLIIKAGEKHIYTKPGQIMTYVPDDKLFLYGSIQIAPIKEGEKIQIASLKRGYGTPSYRGTLELYTTAEGIVIINEVLVEEYLCGVVPSEMPASFHKEALKCQAICARSYAYCQMTKYAYPTYKAHVDDSTSYQVYGNSKERKETTSAVRATEGLTVKYRGNTVITYYFSTSKGTTTTVEAWGTKKTKKNAYLGSVLVEDSRGKAYEENCAWYKWKICVPEDRMQKIVELHTKTELGELKKIVVKKRGEGGVALQLLLVGSERNVIVETEYEIRKTLGHPSHEILKQDGSVGGGHEILPSAFIEISHRNGNYYIVGGGFGHGIGMSQNGANEMAKCGIKYKEILSFFYPGSGVA